MPYNPALDGLRAIAVFAVLAFHAGAPLAGGGYVGVDLFFVLSGFLITTILKREYEAQGSIDLLRFYGRRAIRLYPTLLLVLAAFLAAAPYVWPELPAWRYAAMTALYITDYTRAFLGEPVVLSYTWSLSVEEHFYLLWPILLPLVLRRQNPVVVLAAAYALATAWRIGNYYWLGWEPTYFRFDTRLSGLVLGCLLAFMPRLPGRFAIPALAAFAFAVAVPSFHTERGLGAVLILAELASATLVVFAVSSRGQCSALAWPPLAYLGKLSYGIYLWHFPLVYWLRENTDWATTLAVTSVAAVSLSAATYHLVDAPLRRGRHTSRPADDHQPAAALATRHGSDV